MMTIDDVPTTSAPPNRERIEGIGSALFHSFDQASYVPIRREERGLNVPRLEHSFSGLNLLDGEARRLARLSYLTRFLA
jgi:hypothetical protein